MTKLDIQYKGEFEIIQFCELSLEQQNEINDNYDSIEESSFFVDNNDGIHDLNNFMRIANNDKLKSFHGYHSTCFFHSYLIQLSECGESAKLFEVYS